MRSSDRRKIADQIISEYTIEVPPEVSREKPENVHDTTTIGVGAIRNSLLPENSLSARFTTTAGKDLKQVSGTVYFGAHPGEEQRILWIKLEDRLIPTGRVQWHVGKILAEAMPQSIRSGGILGSFLYSILQMLYCRSYEAVRIL